MAIGHRFGGDYLSGLAMVIVHPKLPERFSVRSVLAFAQQNDLVLIVRGKRLRMVAR